MYKFDNLKFSSIKGGCKLGIAVFPHPLHQQIQSSNLPALIIKGKKKKKVSSLKKSK